MWRYCALRLPILPVGNSSPIYSVGFPVRAILPLPRFPRSTLQSAAIRRGQWRHGRAGPILWFLVLISVVRSMDAVNFSVAAKQIMPEYGLSNVQMGMLYTVFTTGYALFHIPGGWLGDAVGPRRILTLAVLWWSVFTAVTAIAGNWWLAGLIGPLGIVDGRSFSRRHGRRSCVSKFYPCGGELDGTK